MISWVDGALVEEHRARVSAFDHGLTVGDGVFETVKVADGQPFALTRHLDRLDDSARVLGLPVPDRDGMHLAVGEVLAANGNLPAARLRLTLTGGVAPLGSDRGSAPPTLIIAVATLRAWPASADVVTVSWTRNERGATAGVKTTSYAENVVALAHAHARGAGEAIFANTRGELCEGTGSNVFVGVDGRLITPPLAAGCLAGVTRALLLEWVGAAEETLPLAALAAADEAFLASTTRDVQPILRVDGRMLPAAPGPLTARASRVFAERAEADVDP